MTRQNTSSAVMSQRREAPDSLDYFPTPPWATRALLEVLQCEEPPFEGQSVLEPACGEGHMVKPLMEAFGTVHAADIHHYGARFPTNAKVRDFLADGTLGHTWGSTADWCISNPPFNLGTEFIWQALARSRRGVAMLLPTSFCEGVGRYQRLFRDRPPSFELVMSERVIMAKGVLRDPDVPYRSWNKKKKCWEIKKPSTATAYSWFVWNQDAPGGDCRKLWTGPVRKRLTRPGDYPPLPEHERIPEGGLV